MMISMTYGEQRDNPSLFDLAESYRKRVREQGSWRDVAAKIWDVDSTIRTVRDTYKQNRNDKQIPDSLRDISIEDARRRGLSEQERQRRNRDFAVRRKWMLRQE